MTDATFTFDTKSMQTAMDVIANSLTSLTKNLESMTTKVGKNVETKTKKVSEGTKKATKETGSALRTSVSNFSEGAGEMLSTTAKKVMALGVAYLGLRSIINNIPEIGRTFQHAGDIMMRNLLWPLRKLLIPLLQKILDWTRTHRAMFVQWGTYIANAFRTVYQIVMNVIKLVKTFTDSFMRTFEGIFGKVTGKMSNIVNIIMFKLATLIMYITELLTPLFETLGSLWAKVAGLFKNMFDGIIIGMGDISKPVSDLIAQITKLGKAEGDLLSKNGIVAKSFKNIGMVIGGVVVSAVLLLAQTFQILANALEKATIMWKMWQAKEDPKEYDQLKKEKERIRQEFIDDTKERGKLWADMMFSLGKSMKENTLASDPEEDDRIEREGKEEIAKIKEQIRLKKEEYKKNPKRELTKTNVGAITTNNAIKVDAPVNVNIAVSAIADITKLNDIGKAGGINLAKGIRRGLNDGGVGVSTPIKEN